MQSQKRAEKAAKEAAAREADLRSYSHILKVGVYSTRTGRFMSVMLTLQK